MFAKWDNKVWTFRGDHKQPEKRKPIAAKLIAGMLEVSGVNQVITVDIHSPQTEGFFSIPVDCLTARFLFERSVAGQRSPLEETPNESSVRMTRDIIFNETHCNCWRCLQLCSQCGGRIFPVMTGRQNTNWHSSLSSHSDSGRVCCAGNVGTPGQARYSHYLLVSPGRQADER